MLFQHVTPRSDKTVSRVVCLHLSLFYIHRNAFVARECEVVVADYDKKKEGSIVKFPLENLIVS